MVRSVLLIFSFSRSCEMALLVLLFFFHLILDINSQYVPQPRLSVTPEVLTERGSVQIHCHVPDNVKVRQCDFYTEREKRNLKLSPSCQLSVTGSELIRWTGRSSPGTLHITCFYAVDNSVRTPSPHSLPAPVTVLNQKPRLSVSHDGQFDELRFVCEISGSESVTADFSCNLYTGENPQFFLNHRSQKRNSVKVCSFTAQRDAVLNRLQSVKSREVSCDYSLISDPTARSLMSDKHNMMHFFTTTTTTMSDKYNMTRFFPTPTQPSITTEKSTAYSSSESTQQTVTTQKSTAGSLPTVLSVTGVCVLLAGLMSFCLCVCINKQKTESRCKLNTTHRDQGVMMSVLNMNNSGSEAAETYSVISSVPLPALPLDTSGDIKVDSKITVVDTYHVYSSIPDTHVTTNDAVYSLLQMH